MKQYKIYAGLGGGFGGAQYIDTLEFENEEQAAHYAWELAIEEYESYDGLHGLTSVADIYENPEDYGLDEDFTEDDVIDVYRDERESWIEYWAELVE